MKAPDNDDPWSVAAISNNYAVEWNYSAFGECDAGVAYDGGGAHTHWSLWWASEVDGRYVQGAPVEIFVCSQEMQMSFAGVVC